MRFLGAFDRAGLRGLYSAADVVVSMPRSDGLPQSLFEAMACQTPTILGDLAAYKEVAREGEGVLYSAFDAQSLSSTLEKTSRNALRAIGQAGLERVLQIADIRAEAARVSHLYERAASARRRVRRFSPGEAFGLLPRSL